MTAHFWPGPYDDHRNRCIDCGGSATAGYDGTATAGARGTVIICSWDEQHQRRRFSVGYIGAGGLEPNVPYRLDGEGRFVRAADAGGAK